MQQTSTAQPEQFRVRDWTVVPALDRMVAADRTVQLEPKAMSLLVRLAAEPGRPVSKNHLLAAVWGDAIVSEGVLKHLVWDLRRELGDNAREPIYIETIPRRGYRLVAPVEAVPEKAGSGLKRSTWVGLAVAGVATASLLLAFGQTRTTAHMSSSGGHLREVPDSRGGGPYRGAPLTSFPGSEIDPSLSPDGRQVAYAWNPDSETNFDIYVQPIDGVEPRRLTEGPAVDGSPVWSPDGRTIAFLRRSEGREAGGLFAIGVGGGAEQRLAGPDYGAGQGLAWSPDGSRLAVSVRLPGEPFYRIALIGFVSGEVQPLTDPPKTWGGDFDPAFSPDGERLAFRRSAVTSGDDIFIFELETGETRRLTHDQAAILGLAWSADGQNLVLSSDRVPPRGLWRLDVDSGAMEWLPLPGGFVADPTIAPVGGRMVYQHLRCDSNLWQTDGEASRPWMVSTRQEHLPRFSPGGDRVAFLSDRGGTMQIWLAEVDGTGARPVTALDGAVIHSFRWSPSGDRLVFDARGEAGSDIFTARLIGGPVERLTGETDDEVAPSWSADGKRIYFGSNRTGSWQIWSRALDREELRQVTPEGGFSGREDRDGRFLYFVKRRAKGLWRLPIAGGEEERLVDDLRPVDALNWELTSDALYYPAFAPLRGNLGGRGVRQVIRFDLASGVAQPVAELDRNLPYPPGLTVSPDGATILWARLDESNSDLVLVDPFW